MGWSRLLSRGLRDVVQRGSFGRTIALMLLAFLLTGQAQAVPPGNDNFADSWPFYLGLPGSGSNVDATREVGEPEHWEPTDSGSVWFDWTAPATGTYLINTCGSDFDTVLAVYTGEAVDALTLVLRDDDGSLNCPGTNFLSEVSVQAIEGTTYRVAVAGIGGAVGNVSVNVVPPPPPNDNFADAETLVDTLTGTTIGATREAGEPQHKDQWDTGSVWYNWTAPSSGIYSINTCGSGFDTVLAVYTGNSVGALTLVSWDTDGSWLCPELLLPSEIALNAVGGTTYRVAVAGEFGGVGSVQINVVEFPPPPNDSFVNAETLVDYRKGYNVAATHEPGEGYDFAPSESGSIWYNWTSPTTGTYRIHTCGSIFDTVLGVYTGDAVHDLTLVTFNDDGSAACPSSPLLSEVAVAAQAGTIYRVKIVGWNGSVGNVEIRVLPPPPANDNFADAQTLVDSATGNNEYGTIEAGEPQQFGLPVAASIWYNWTPPTNARYAFDTCGSDFNTTIDVYTGGAVNALMPAGFGELEPVGCPVSGTSPVAKVQAFEGITYRVRVGGQGNSSPSRGNVQVNVSLVPPPPNDNFADAQPLEWLVSGTVVNATREPGEPQHFASGDSGSVWYNWTAPQSGNFLINTCDSQFGLDTVMAVYTGESVDALTLVANDDDGSSNCPGTPTLSEVMVPAVAGTTYRVAIAGFGGAVGLVRVNVVPPAPGNDNFASAYTLFDTATGYTINATAEFGEPFHYGMSLYGTIWYNWTAPATGDYLLNTCGSNTFSPAAMAVYTGSTLETLALVVRIEGEAQPASSCPDDLSSSEVLVPAVAGTTYRIAVMDGLVEGAGGGIRINVVPVVVIANGDADADGSINVADLTAIQNFVEGIEATAPPGDADVNNDAMVTAADAALLGDHLINGTPLPP